MTPPAAIFCCSDLLRNIYVRANMDNQTVLMVLHLISCLLDCKYLDTFLMKGIMSYSQEG